MEAPKCRLCGAREWNHVCSGEAQNEIARRAHVTAPATRPVTRTVTRNAGVKSDRVGIDARAWQDNKRLKRALKEAQAEIDALHGEVAQLKRQLAGGADERSKPMTSAERVRKLRAKRKAERVEFKG